MDRQSLSYSSLPSASNSDRILPGGLALAVALPPTVYLSLLAVLRCNERLVNVLKSTYWRAPLRRFDDVESSTLPVLACLSQANAFLNVVRGFPHNKPKNKAGTCVTPPKKLYSLFGLARKENTGYPATIFPEYEVLRG